MNASSLAAALGGSPAPILLHVLPAEHFAARRIAGAINACVYETAFIDQVRALAPDPATPLVVYGEGAPSLDSEEAAAHLRAAGYLAVTDYRGGLRDWEAAGFPLESDGPLTLLPPPTGRFRVNVATSVIRWTGRNLFNFHHGRVTLADGEAELQEGTLRRARFSVDLGSIVCEDLAGLEVHALLLRHLLSPDFFDADRHPAPHFEATRLEPLTDATEGTSNYEMSGNLTLRGVTQDISFPVVIAAPDADHLTAQAQFEIDRTRWGSRYGSGKYFAFLGKHVVNDQIALQLKIDLVRADSPSAA